VTQTVAIQRAVLASDLPAPARLVMLTLLVRADYKSGTVPAEHTPSLTELATLTDLGRSTVARVLGILEAAGWVDRDRPDIAAARSEGAKTGYRLKIGGSPAAGLVPERDHEGSPAAGPAVVPQRDRGSPAAGRLIRKTPTGSTEPLPNHGQPARARGTRIPANFTVTPEMVAWHQENTPGVDGRRETAKFIDHWQAASGANAVKRDWVAAWRNWMRKAAEWAPGGARASPGATRPSTTDQRVAAGLALLAEFTDDPPEGPARALTG
jgi:hypothetical protein